MNRMSAGAVNLEVKQCSLSCAVVATNRWPTKLLKCAIFRDVNKDLTFKAKARTKDWALKAKARTKD